MAENKRDDTRIGGKGFGNFFVTAWNVQGKFVNWSVSRRYRKEVDGKSVWQYSQGCSFGWSDISDFLRLAFWIAFLSDQWLAEQEGLTPDHLRKRIKQSRATSYEAATDYEDEAPF